MPTLSVTWDLSIIIIVAIVMSFVFIVGVEKTVKIIVASYIAIITTQGLGNVLGRLIGSSDVFLTSLGLEGDTTVLPLMKIFFFVLCILILVLKSGMDITFEHKTGMVMSIVMTALLGLSLAGLLLSTLVTYASGSALLDPGFLASSALPVLSEASTLMQLLMLNQDIWYTLPAFLIIVIGFLESSDE
jgi:hypothetical protein